MQAVSRIQTQDPRAYAAIRSYRAQQSNNGIWDKNYLHLVLVTVTHTASVVSVARFEVTVRPAGSSFGMQHALPPPFVIIPSATSRDIHGMQHSQTLACTRSSPFLTHSELRCIYNELGLVR
jgi:hypothetical protein